MKTEEIRCCQNCIHFTWEEVIWDCFYPDCELGHSINDADELTDCTEWVLEE